VISPQLSALLDHAITQGPGRSDELIGQIADALTQLRAEDEFRTACRTILDTLAASNPAPPTVNFIGTRSIAGPKTSKTCSMPWMCIRSVPMPSMSGPWKR
jgi:hypothetical protein